MGAQEVKAQSLTALSTFVISSKEMLRDYFSRRKRRVLDRFITTAVLAPIMLVAGMLWNGFDCSNPFLWVVLLLGLVFFVIGVQFAWLLCCEAPSAPTPAQLRQQQFLAVADSVDSLPGKMSFPDRCKKLDDKQTRKLLHQLHQIPPGKRHLRDVVGNLTLTPSPAPEAHSRG
jgi:hypothetical protein